MVKLTLSSTAYSNSFRSYMHNSECATYQQWLWHHYQARKIISNNLWPLTLEFESPALATEFVLRYD